jgi:hypothetical protein
VFLNLEMCVFYTPSKLCWVLLTDFQLLAMMDAIAIFFHPHIYMLESLHDCQMDLGSWCLQKAKKVQFLVFFSQLFMLFI